MFEEVTESMARREFWAEDDSICQFHLRKDGQLTIRNIIVPEHRQKQGIGSRFLARLEQVEGAVFLLAKCPADLPSNSWYAYKGFTLTRTEEAKSKSRRLLNVWTKPVSGRSPRPKQLELSPEPEEADRWSESDLFNHWSHER